MTPEGRITKRILKELRARGGWWVKIHVSEFQMAGTPDIIGCYRGRFVAFEVKTPATANNTSLAQDIMLARIDAAGGFQAVVTSHGQALGVLDEIDSLIAEGGY